MSARHFRRYAAIALVTAVGLSLAACSSSSKSSTANGKTTISVDCPPLATSNGGKDLANWNKDVANFEKINPTIDIVTVSVGAMCDNPQDFTARLTGGQETNVFYGYNTDMQQVLNSGQAANITKYVTPTNFPSYTDMTKNITQPYTRNGQIYGIGYAGYTMGLIYNTKLFKQAGITTPPSTWPEVIADAKTISALGHGIAGYADYSAQNTGGWHFTDELYSQGGSDLSADGKTATVNTPQGLQVLRNLHQMATVDKSMGTQQLLNWGALLTNAGAGKVGMFLGAPDVIPTLVGQFKADYNDWAVAPSVGQSGPATGALGGGSGSFFNKKDTPAQIIAGVKWIQFEELTPGQGQLNYQLQASEKGVPVGYPEPEPWNPGTTLAKQLDTVRAKYANMPLTMFTAFNTAAIPVVAEPPNAQAIYAILDGAMSATLTQPNANLQDLLNTANKKIQQLLDSQPGS